MVHVQKRLPQHLILLSQQIADHIRFLLFQFFKLAYFHKAQEVKRLTITGSKNIPVHDLYRRLVKIMTAVQLNDPKTLISKQSPEIHHKLHYYSIKQCF